MLTTIQVDYDPTLATHQRLVQAVRESSMLVVTNCLLLCVRRPRREAISNIPGVRLPSAQKECHHLQVANSRVI
jgi:hypothetical protein